MAVDRIAAGGVPSLGSGAGCPGPGARALGGLNGDEGEESEIECGRIDIPFLDQHAFQRTHPKLRFRQFGMLVVVLMIMRGACFGQGVLVRRI